MENLAPLRPISSEMLTGIEGVAHGFFTRNGGVSSGIYSGLNVGYGSSDDRDSVAENRARVAAHLGFPGVTLSTPHQVHSADVVAIGEPIDTTNRPKVDAVVTATPGLIVGVLTADCGPVLFADEEGAVIAAAHAGWKGALNGILENTIETMIAVGARRSSICAVLGPSISGENYEVGPEFRDRFLEAESQNEKYFLSSGTPGHFMFDLPGYILARLSAAGIEKSHAAHCTYREETRFFSYRRATHRGEPDYGRQISAIVLTR
ncbi:peptidoglycan editing factor PgeF [Oricola cellulosilytica]|uniref:peptidoglycan editing factor PgeF n=1 Tax=Oricola cellulosilytica TaxID=1429082 RepID=UPI003D16904B